MKITYGYKWFRVKKRFTETWHEDRARQAHENRQLYAALVEQDSGPICFVEVNDKYIGIGFLDSLQREYLSYTFDEVEPGRMFLNEITYREFLDDSDKVKNGTTYIFKQDGKTYVIKEDFLTNTRYDMETQVDPSGNWEPYPQFGQYRSIIRENR